MLTFKFDKMFSAVSYEIMVKCSANDVLLILVQWGGFRHVVEERLTSRNMNICVFMSKIACHDRIVRTRLLLTFMLRYAHTAGNLCRNAYELISDTSNFIVLCCGVGMLCWPLGARSVFFVCVRPRIWTCCVLVDISPYVCTVCSAVIGLVVSVTEV